MSAYRRDLTRWLGLYCLIMGAAVLAQPAVFRAGTLAMLEQPGTRLLAGVLTLIFALVWLLAWQNWRAGAVGIALSLVGWLSLAKALVLLLLPADRLLALYGQALAQPGWNGGVTLLLGLWLCLAGWRRPG